MKTYCLLFSLLTCFISSYSQNTTGRTIFEVLKVDGQPCEIESRARREGMIEGILDPSAEKDQKPSHTDEILAAKNSIAKHFANLHIDSNKPFNFYEFVDFKPYRSERPTLGYLVKQEDNYILYTKDKKLIWKKKLGYVEKHSYDNEGFNTYDNSTLTTYYHYTGKIISTNEYEYIEHDNGNYFRVLKNKKWGLIDQSGKLIVPASYDYISSFVFNNRTYYVIDEKGKEQYILADDLQTKIYILHNNKTPVIIANKYWQLGGKIFDPVAHKQLFCNFQDLVYLPEAELFMFISPKDGKFFFDFEGNLLDGHPGIMNVTHVKNDVFIVEIGHYIDSFSTSRNRPKRALARIKGNSIQWLSKPAYKKFYYNPETDLIQTRMDEDNYYRNEIKAPVNIPEGKNLYIDYDVSKGFVLGIKDSTSKSFDSIISVSPTFAQATSGFIDTKGNVIITDGKYRYVSPFPPTEGWFVCVKDSSSELLNPSTNKIIPLKYSYTTIKPINKDSTLFAGYANGSEYILDKNYERVNMHGFSGLSFDKGTGLIQAKFDINDGRPNSWNRSPQYEYLDKKLNRLEFKINDTVVHAFMSIYKLENGKYVVALPGYRWFIQLSKNKFLFTPYKFISYDSIAKWYIGTNDQGLKGTFDSTGTVVIPFVCKDILPLRNAADNLRIFLPEIGSQVISTKGEIMFDLKYKHVLPLFNQNYIVTLGDRRGIVTKDGEIILPFDYSYIRIEHGKVYARRNPSSPLETYDLQILLDKQLLNNRNNFGPH
jgi:hypothetical protein